MMGLPVVTNEPHSPVQSFFADARLRWILVLSVVLVVCSNLETNAAIWLNAALGHAGALGARGWTIIMAARVLLSALLVVAVLRLPTTTAAGGARTKSASLRVSSFDPLLGLRALACMMVMLGHYFIVVFGSGNAPNEGVTLGKILMMPVRSSPWAGVWIFFTLSGYLMGKGFERRRYALDGAGVRNFYRNRLLRIVPVYMAAVVLFAVFVQPEVWLPRNAWQMAQLAVFDFRGNTPFVAVGALWSVCTEVQFYLLAPFLFAGLYAAHRRWPAAFWWGIAMLYPLCTVARLACTHWPNYPATAAYAGIAGLNPYQMLCYPTLPFNLDLFVVGMSLNLMPKSVALGRLVRSGGGLVALGGLLYVFATLSANLLHVLHIGFLQFWAVCPVFCSLLAAVFILCAERRPRVPHTRTLRGRCLRAVEGTGVLAYALYVFHSQIFISIRTLLPAPRLANGTQLLYLPLAFALTFAVATFFYRFVEQPFEQRKHVLDGPVTDAP